MIRKENWKIKFQNFAWPGTLTETFAVKLLQIVVSDASPKQIPARILVIELTTIINFSRLNATKNAHL